MLLQKPVAYGASVGLPSSNRKDMIQALKKGLPVSSFERLKDEIGVSEKVLASISNIALRTLTRRKQEGRFHTDESERLLRIGILFDQIVDMFGDVELARRWLKMPHKALGGKSPLEYADTEPGAREVEDLLGRIAHGVFS